MRRIWVATASATLVVILADALGFARRATDPPSIAVGSYVPWAGNRPSALTDETRLACRPRSHRSTPTGRASSRSEPPHW